MTINTAYANFLNTQKWDYFTTLTYKWDVKQKQNRMNMDRMVGKLQESDTNFNMFWISEWHRSGTSTHSHLLTKGVDVTLIDKYWSNSNLGYKKFNDHKVYEKDKGANFYMAKYIDKEIDYDIFGL